MPRARALATLLLAGAALAAWRGSPRADAAADSLETFRSLVTPQRSAVAEPRLRRWLGDLGPGPAADTARAAGLDLLTEALLNLGRWREPADLAVAGQAVRAQESLYGRDSPRAGYSLIMQARLLYRAGDWTRARPLAERGLALCERAYGERHRSVMRGLHYLANIYENDADYDAAERLYRREVAVAETLYGAQSAELGNALNSLGVMYRKTGRVSQARPLYERALALRERALGPDHPDLAFNLGNLANLLTDVGEFARARPLYERAVAIVERGLGVEHPLYAFALGNLAGCELALADTSRALEHLERALALAEEHEGPDHPDLSYHLDNLGILWTARGEYARARSALDRALAIREKAFGPDRPEVARVLEARARLALVRGELAPADSDARRALTIRERNLDPDNPEVAASRVELAAVRRAGGDDSTALALAVSGEAAAREHFRLTARVLEERLALQYAASRPSGLALALSIAADHPGESAFVTPAWDALVRSRARVLDEMARRQRAIESRPDSATTALADSLEAASQAFAWLLASGAGASPAGRQRLQAARERKERCEYALAAHSATFRGQEALGSADLARVLHALGDRQVLVAFARYFQAPPAGQDPRWYLREDAEPGRARYVAFVARGGEPGVRAVPLGPAALVDSAVARFAREAGRRPNPLAWAADARRLLALGRAARRLVWDPVAPATEGAREVFLVPDGTLQSLNFATLPLDDGRWLVEAAAPLHQLSCERDLALPVAGRAAGRGLLALGDPDFERRGEAADGPRARAPGRGERSLERGRGRPANAASGCEDFRSLDFEPLPGSRAEVGAVASIWRSASRESAVVLVGRGASESAFRARAPACRWLHLATHGFFLPNVCGGNDARGRPVADTIALENPLLRSGLALAGANRRLSDADGETDGILTADEIAKLDLSGVELAVLSACDTGRGDVRAGEGVLGLRRGLQVAGVRTVLMSMWSVDDEATRRWMSALYEARLRRGLDVAAAVRAADLSVLRERRAHGESDHPYYWGAFLACGDWR